MSRLQELIAELCPDGVEYKALGELGAFYGGLTGKSKKDFGDGAKFVTYNNVYGNPAVNLEEYGLVNVGPDERQNTVELGDVLFTISSENRGEAGLTSVMTVDPGEPWYLNSFCTGWRLHDKSILLPDFLKHVLRGPEVREAISKTANGVTRFNISKPRLAKVRIPVPPIEIQREIVRILDEYTAAHDELVRQLEDEITTRISERTTIIREEFAVRFGDPCSKESTFDRLGNHCRVVTGNTPSRSHPEYFGKGIDWIKSDNIHPNARMLDTAKEQLTAEGEAAARVAEPGWLLMICIAGSPNTIGNTSMVDRRVAYNQQINGIDPLDVNPRYLQCALTLAKQKIEKTLKPAVTCILNKRELESLLLPFPPRELQDEFAMILEKLDLAGFAEYLDALQEELTLRECQLTLVRNQLLSFPEKVA